MVGNGMVSTSGAAKSSYKQPLPFTIEVIPGWSDNAQEHLKLPSLPALMITTCPDDKWERAAYIAYRGICSIYCVALNRYVTALNTMERTYSYHINSIKWTYLMAVSISFYPFSHICTIPFAKMHKPTGRCPWFSLPLQLLDWTQTSDLNKLALITIVLFVAGYFLWADWPSFQVTFLP